MKKIAALLLLALGLAQAPSITANQVAAAPDATTATLASIEQHEAEARRMFRKKPARAKKVIYWILAGTGAVVATTGGIYAYRTYNNYTEDKKVWGTLKDLFTADYDFAKKETITAKDKSLKFAQDHYIALPAGALGIIAVIAASYDLSRADKSVLKKLADYIYNRIAGENLQEENAEESAQQAVTEQQVTA